MAIAFDNSAGQFTSNPVTEQTQAYTVGTGDDRFLYVWILGDVGATSGISGVTYNGDSLTKLDTHGVTGGRAFDVWYMVAPATGSNNVVITRGASGLIVSGFASYSGVDQTTPIPHNTTTVDNTSDATYESSITTTIADSWMVAGARDSTGRTLTPVSGFVERQNGGGMHLLDSNGVITPAGTTNLSGTFSGDCKDATIIFELAVAGAAPAGTNMQINIGDTWKVVAGAQINIGDSWKTVTSIKQNIGDTWKDVF